MDQHIPWLSIETHGDDWGSSIKRVVKSSGETLAASAKPGGPQTKTMAWVVRKNREIIGGAENHEVSWDHYPLVI